MIIFKKLALNQSIKEKAWLLNLFFCIYIAFLCINIYMQIGRDCLTDFSVYFVFVFMICLHVSFQEKSMISFIYLIYLINIICKQKKIYFFLSKLVSFIPFSCLIRLLVLSQTEVARADILVLNLREKVFQSLGLKRPWNFHICPLGILH